ncbi:hypothetical protein D9M68_655230 [compost metagenome]
MDGDDLHPLGIAFQAQQSFFAMAFGAALGVEPAQQLLQAGAQQALRLQQFGQVQQVGQAALAVDQSQQALRHLLLVQPSAEGAHEALLLPKLMIAFCGFALGVPGLGVVLAGSQVRRAAPKQAAGQGIAQSPFTTRFGIGGQHRGQLGGFLAVPDVFLATAHAGHAAGSQFLGHLGGLAVAGHQYRDIATFQRRMAALVIEIGFATAAGVQQGGNAPGRVLGSQRTGFALAEMIVGQPDQRQRRILLIVAGRQHQLRPRALAGTDLWVTEAWLGERHGAVE